MGALGALLLAVLTASILNPVHNTAHAQSIEKTYAENDIEPVRTFSASDDEGTVLAWFLTGVDGGDFIVDDGVLNFRAPPDYEAPTDANGDNVYDVSVNVTDGTNTTTAALTVSVTNVEEQGTPSFSSLQPEVGIPLSVILTDPDGGLAEISWTWEKSIDKVTWNPISDATSDSYTSVDQDVGSYLRVTVTYADGEGPDKSARGVSHSVVRKSHPPGHGPAFPATETGVRSIAENTAPGTPVGAPVAGSDEEGHVLTYTLSGADAAFFDVDRSSGQLLTDALLDYEFRNAYSMMLTVSDPTNASDAIIVMVDITNLEEEGTITLSTPQPFAGDEVVAYLDDPDGSVRGVAWQWELSPDRTVWSVIDGTDSSGSYEPADRDVGSYLRVTGSYSDGEGLNKSAQAVSFNPVKAAVDHAPIFSNTETGLRTVTENTPPGTPIGEPFTATDADGHALTYLILDELDADSFDINPSTGQLLTKAPLDYETKSTYRLTVAVHDGGDEHDRNDHSLDATLAVTIVITNVDEESVATCFQHLPASGTVSGSWDDSCLSANRPLGEGGRADSDYYSRFYTFTLEDSAVVTIALTSTSVVDTYLYLMDGVGGGGPIEAEHDDIDATSDRNSRIEEDLEAGEYTIEATTFDPETSGDFTLVVVIDGAASQPQPPMPEPGLDVVYTAISSGANHVCGLTTDGAVMCWGDDSEGQVSNRPTSGRFTQISSGDNHTCALREGGAVICWGGLALP